MDGDKQTYKSGILLVLLATLGWSLSGTFVRLVPDLDGWQINTWRGLWTGVLLLLYLLATYGRETFNTFRAIPPAALWISASCFAFGSTMYVASLALVSTAVVSVIGATAPLVAAMLSPWITKERPGPEAWIASVIALAGIAYIAREQAVSGSEIGLLFALFIPITFAGQTLALRRYRNVDMVPAICLGGFLSFILAGILGFVAGHPAGGFGVPLPEIGLLSLMALLQLSLPLIFYTYGARSVPAVTLTLVSMLDALLNPFWSWVIVKEMPTNTAMIGGGIVLLAILIAIFGARFLQNRKTSLPEAPLPPDMH